MEYANLTFLYLIYRYHKKILEFDSAAAIMARVRQGTGLTLIPEVAVRHEINTKTLLVVNCTLAENMVEPPSGTPGFLLGMGYWRGGGLYMSNGYLHLQSSTVVDNAVYGAARTDDLDKPNLAGGVRPPSAMPTPWRT